MDLSSKKFLSYQGIHFQLQQTWMFLRMTKARAIPSLHQQETQQKGISCQSIRIIFTQSVAEMPPLVDLLKFLLGRTMKIPLHLYQCQFHQQTIIGDVNNFAFQFIDGIMIKKDLFLGCYLLYIVTTEGEMPIWLQPGQFHCTTQGFQRSKNNIHVVKAFASLSNEFNN